MRASSELQFGALRKGGGMREAGSTVAESLVVCSIKWVRTRFGEGGGQLDRRRARGGLNPCVRKSKARTERFQGKS